MINYVISEGILKTSQTHSEGIIYLIDIVLCDDVIKARVEIVQKLNDL